MAHPNSNAPDDPAPIGRRRYRAVTILLLLAAGCARTTVKDERLAFNLPDTNGEMVSQSDERFAGKVLLVDIWGSWCPPCRVQIPHLARLQKEYQDQGLEIVGIDFEMLVADQATHQEDIKGFMRQMDMNYLVLLGGETNDVATSLPDLQNFTGFPTTIVIGRDGLVREVIVGFSERDMDGLEKRIQKLLGETAGTPSPPNENA